MEILQQDIRDLRSAQTEDVNFLHTRIDEVTKKVDSVKTELSSKLDSQTKSLTDHFDEGLKNVGKRLGALEKWRWLIVGGGAVIGFIVVDVLVRVFEQPISRVLHAFIGR